jgi:membrane peptidoglycan carboxypeptidase
MVQSVNTPFIQLGMDVGLAEVAATATATGLLHSSLGARVPAFSLGNSTPSAIRMADAYATFAAGGMHQEPYSVQRVTRHGGTVFAQHDKAVRAVSAKTAEAVSAGLRGSASYGAGKASVAAGRGLAAKPGTTQDRAAGWFVGYGTKVSTAVAVFRVDPKKQELLPLRTTVMNDSPASIWTSYLKAIS